MDSYFQMGGGRICSMWDAAGALRCIFSGSDLVTSAATHGGAHISTPSMSPTSPLCCCSAPLCCTAVAAALLLHSALLLFSLLHSYSYDLQHGVGAHLCSLNTVQHSDLHINIPAVVKGPNI